MKKFLIVVLAIAASLICINANAQVCTMVSVGGADTLEPGEDANFSLIALERCNGMVTGQAHDNSYLWGPGIFAVHMEVTCLRLVDNDAWVGALVTKPAEFAGFPLMIRVRDNGTSANDAPDQASFWTFGDDCTLMPDLPLMDFANGQVEIFER